MTTERNCDCRNWQAFHNFMPPKPATLRVEGECVFPTAGYKVALVRRSCQDGVLVLERVTSPPSGLVPQVVSTERVEYLEETDVSIKSVKIIPDNVEIEPQVLR